MVKQQAIKRRNPAARGSKTSGSKRVRLSAQVSRAKAPTVAARGPGRRSTPKGRQALTGSRQPVGELPPLDVGNDNQVEEPETTDNQPSEAPMDDGFTTDDSTVSLTDTRSPQRVVRRDCTKRTRPQTNATAERQGMQLIDQLSVNTSASNNFMSAITNIVKSAVEGVRDSVVALSESGSQLGNPRSAELQKLPEFNGDPFEWLNFKEIYEDSTKRGGYSNRENIQRLSQALRGKARDVVKTLLATSREPEKIIKDLEMHFGNMKLIAESVKRELLNLPALDSRALSIAQFSSKVSNTISAFHSLRLSNMLQDSSLFISVHEKLTSEMKFAFRGFAAKESSGISNLEKLANYLQWEAEISNEAGLFELEAAPAINALLAEYNPTSRHTRAARTATVCMSVGRTSDFEREKEAEPPRESCLFCNRANHDVKDCTGFKRVSAIKKHHFVKNHRLCFRCLGGDHLRRSCRAPVVCDSCEEKSHLTSLHMSREDWEEIKANRGGGRGKMRKNDQNHSRRGCHDINRDPSPNYHRNHQHNRQNDSQHDAKQDPRSDAIPGTG